MGIEIENGTNATLSDDGETSIGWGVCVGVEGCVLKIKYRQRNQQFEFPIFTRPGFAVFNEANGDFVPNHPERRHWRLAKRVRSAFIET